MRVLKSKWIKIFLSLVVIVVIAYFLFPFIPFHATGFEKVKLPNAMFQGPVSIEQALKERRSIRKYKNEPITLEQAAQLLWAAQGITSAQGFRTAPSAGALYPLEIYVAVGNVVNLPAGIYHYLPAEQSLEKLSDKDVRPELATTTGEASTVKDGAMDIIIVGEYMKPVQKYGERGKQFVHMEAGHVSENIYLQAVSLKLGTVAIGGFNDDAVKRILNLSKTAHPLYIMPVGKI